MSKPLMTILATACALALPALAHSRPLTLTAQLKNYGGDGAYLAAYLTDAKGAYVRTLWVAGKKSKYYKHLTDWQAETQDPTEFLDSLRFEIGAKEVYVFTPKGKVIGLSGGATPVDFAYAVHTEVGHRTMGAKVNGRLVP